MKPIFVESIGVAAPGMSNREKARAVLRGETPYVAEPLAALAPVLLPPNERRRATPSVRLAFQAAEDAMRMCSVPAATLASIFASSDADLNVIHRICTALGVTPRMISPTDFHNSVHNAAAGYWSIAVGARGASTAISAHDYSFAAGLAEAVGTVTVDETDALLVAFDLPPPEPLFAKRRIEHPVGIALVLTRERTAHSMAQLTCTYCDDGESVMSDAELERLRLSNPAARGLPLLRAIEGSDATRVVLPLNGAKRLAVDVSPTRPVA